jgi:RNA polymerase sigma factor (sigma-70 family)
MANSAANQVIQHFRRLALVRDGAKQTDGQLLGYFIEQRNEAAFEALVRRHGPMVMGICRRVLHSQHDAEDAFQATFLVLFRKAASVMPREMVANWLYGVAHQTAIRARSLNAARRQREKTFALTARTETAPRECRDDLQLVLDQELSRLPDKYRIPVVLCDLEGNTRKEAARQLGWPEGSVSSRLARARAILARRLTRRGVTLSVAALAELISVNAASACVPGALVVSTVKAASLLTAGHMGPTGLISTRVAALADQVLRIMFMTKLKGITGVLLVIGMAIGVPCIGLVLLNHRPAVGHEAKKASQTRAVQRSALSAPQPKLRATLEGEKDGTAVALSGDGKMLASESEDETVKLWEVATAREKAVLKTMHQPPVSSLALSRDGKVLATGGSEGTVKLWDVVKGKEKAVLKGHADRVAAVALSADGKLVASASADRTVRLWDAATGREKAVCKGHTNKVTSVAISGDGKLLLSGSEDNTLKLWDAATGREIASLEGHTDRVTSVALSSDGKLAASASEDDTVKLWDVATGKERTTLKGHQAEVISVAISGDGKLVASASGDKTVKLWDAATGREKATLIGHTNKVTSVAISGNGRLVVSGSADKTVKLWDVPSSYR